MLRPEVPFQWYPLGIIPITAVPISSKKDHISNLPQDAKGNQIYTFITQ